MAVQPSPDKVQELQSKVFLAAKDNKPDVIQDCLTSLHPDVVKDVLNHRFNHHRRKLTPLLIAAWKGHLTVVELLVNEFNVDLTQEIYMLFGVHNALTCAAYQGHLDIVKVLVNKGCSMSARGEDEITPACMSCYQGHLDVLKYLLQNGSAVDDRSSSGGTTCLMAASSVGNHEIVKYLLTADANPNEQDDRGRTALHWAAERNAHDIIPLLLDKRANLFRDNDGHSPLIVAALHCASASVHVILQSTDVNQSEKINALELLGALQATENTIEAVRHIRQAMEERYKNPYAVLLKPHSPLPTLSNVQESQTLEELQARQADQHLFRLECLATLIRILGWASHHTMKSFLAYFNQLRGSGQHSKAIAVLLHGIRNDANASAFDIFCCYSQFSFNFAEMLQNGQSGFFPEVEQVMEVIFTKMENNDTLARFITCAQNTTWLHYLLVGLVVARGQEEGMRLQRMAKRFMCFDSNSAVLHAAVQSCWKRHDGFRQMNVDDLPYDLLVSLLLQCGADVHFKDDKKNTALHVVALFSQEGEYSDLLSRMAKVLVQAGSLVGVQNREGKTPLDLAGPALAADLRELYPVSLKSLAATAVINRKIQYATEIPKDLEEYVDKH